MPANYLPNSTQYTLSAAACGNPDVPHRHQHLVFSVLFILALVVGVYGIIIIFCTDKKCFQHFEEGFSLRKVTVTAYKHYRLSFRDGVS